MSHQTPYHEYAYNYSSNRPPPLFAPKLNHANHTSPRPDTCTGSGYPQDGAPVFEMPADSVVPSKIEKNLSPKPQQPDAPVQANPWPFYLEDSTCSKSAQEEGYDKPEKMATPAAQEPELANPWPYFGPQQSGNLSTTQGQGQSPEFSNPAKDSLPSQTDTQVQPPCNKSYKPFPGTAQSLSEDSDMPRSPQDEPGSASSPTFYPAPLKLAYRPAKPASPVTFKPYAPPPSQDAYEAQSTPLSGVGKTDSQSTVNSVSYRPYRPNSPQPPVSVPPPRSHYTPATSPANVSRNTASPPNLQQSYPTGAASHHCASPKPAIHPTSPLPPNQSPASKPTTAPASPVPQPLVQQAVLANSPSPNAQSANSQSSNASPQPSPIASTHSRPSHASPHLTHSATMASLPPAVPPVGVGPPYTQPQYAAHVPSPNYAAASPSEPPATPAPDRPQPHSVPGSVESPDYSVSGPPIMASSQAQPAYNSHVAVQPNPNYNIPQPTYASTTSPPLSTLLFQRPTLPQQHTGQVSASPQPQYSSMEQPSSSVATPQSPPPPYTHTMPTRPDSQPPTAGHASPYQPPPPSGPYLQPSYPTQPTYAHTGTPGAPPPLQGQPTYGLQPPPLPPRPSSTHGPAPSTFGAPAGYNPANYPVPPKTYFNPPPALPPRPSGKLFGSSSAEKWLKKTGQALESTLAPYLQVQPDPRYRAASFGSQPGGQYHAPHMAPQYRGNLNGELPPPGPGGMRPS